MLMFKYSILCTSALFILIGAEINVEEVQKMEKRIDEKTYVIEPSNELLTEATTIFPPLIEGEETSAVS